MPRCGCGSTLLLTSEPPLARLKSVYTQEQENKERERQLEEQRQKEEEKQWQLKGDTKMIEVLRSLARFDRWDSNRDREGLSWVMYVFEMVLNRCLCCSKQLQHNPNDSMHKYYQCANEKCFIRNRNKMEQTIRNTFDTYYNMKTIPQQAFDCVKFNICKKCGDEIGRQYSIMVTSKYICNTNYGYDSYSQWGSLIIQTLSIPQYKYNFNNMMVISRYLRRFEQNRVKQTVQNQSTKQSVSGVDYGAAVRFSRKPKDRKKVTKWQERKDEAIYNPKNKFYGKLDEIESLFYVKRASKQHECADNDDEQSPQCICGNGHMTPKINCKGKWYTLSGEGYIYFPTKLKCNICQFTIQKWDPYFTCQFGKLMNTIGHEYGFRICKLCAVLLNKSKSKPFENSISNDYNIFSRLSDDMMYIVLQYAVSSYVSIINLSQVNKFFAGYLSLIGKKYRIAEITNDNNLDISDIKPDVQLNQLWKQLVLFYWPSFMEKRMIEKYSNNVHQRWDLLFRVRFKSLKQYFENGYHTDRWGRKWMPNANSKPFKFHKGNSKRFIENCNKQISEYDQMILKEMEDLGYKYQFRCPLWKQELDMVVSEINVESAGGVTKHHHCKVCNKNVYTARTKQQLKEYVSKGVCFAFEPNYLPKSKALTTTKLTEKFPEPVAYGSGEAWDATYKSWMEPIESADSEDNTVFDKHAHDSQW